MSDNEGPLSRQAIERIESTQLPQLDRHHLRLLSHCLVSFQSMQPRSADGALPSETARRQWCLDQPRIAEDPGFLNVMLEQLDVAAVQLEQIAKDQNVVPMALTLEQLIHVIETRCHHQQQRRSADDA